MPSGSEVTDMFSDRHVATVDDLASFHVELAPHQGMALLVCRAAGPDEEPEPAAG
jgi:hypothetical protein